MSREDDVLEQYQEGEPLVPVLPQAPESEDFKNVAEALQKQGPSFDRNDRHWKQAQLVAMLAAPLMNLSGDRTKFVVDNCLNVAAYILNKVEDGVLDQKVWRVVKAGAQEEFPDPSKTGL